MISICLALQAGISKLFTPGGCSINLFGRMEFYINSIFTNYVKKLKISGISRIVD